MATTEIVKRPGAHVANREEFGVAELRQNAELAAIAMSARAKAETESRYIYAERNPRDWEDVRIRVVNNCKDLSFAKAAWYKVPNRGEGFTIRFAEAAVQHCGNMYLPSYTIYEDDEKRKINTAAIDLERNITWEKEIIVNKTIERKSNSGRESDQIRIRQKLDGSKVFILSCTDDELASKEASAVSKAQRTNSLRLIRPEILAEAKATIMKTISDGVKNDPDGERKAIADAYAEIGVMPSHLKEYLGCEIAQVQPADLVELRQIYLAIRDGQTTWREIMAEKRGEQEAEQQEGDKATGQGTKEAKERLKKNVAKNEGKLTDEQVKSQAEDLRQSVKAKYDALPDLAETPDAMSVKLGTVIRHQGKLWITNEDQSGWKPFVQAEGSE